MNTQRSPETELPRAGDVVAGKYRIESVIGSGGMGVVLGAEDTSLGRRVAIKFLAPAKARSEDAAARFVREARAAASIQSENVVRVFEVGTLPNGASYIVMEELVGADLAALVETRGPLRFDEAIDYLLEACNAIGEAHKLGIVHRDLKPHNLFLAQRPDGSSCVKVLDFGISKAIDEAAPNLTATDAVMGTPRYMSPEQVRSLKNVDHRADIWALGAILFELVTAAPIFEAATSAALCAMIAMDPPTPLRARRPDAPVELEAVITRCLHKDPNGRFPDVAALAEALAPFASERGRASAVRVAGVVRGGYGHGYASHAPPPVSSSLGFATTGGYPPSGPQVQPSNYPPGAIAAHGYTGYAQQANLAGQQQSTNGAWQQQTGALGPGTMSQRRSSSALFAVLGIVGGLCLLAVVGGAIFYVVSKRGESAAQASVDDASAGPAVAAVQSATDAGPAGPAAPVAAAAAPPGKRLAPSAPKASGAAPAPGTPAGTPTASASAAPAAPAASAEAEAARIARLKQNAQGRCAAQAALFRGTDQNAARTVKNMTCTAASSFSPNSGASNCDRANCRKACTILDDKSCIFQLDNAERGNPLPF